MQTEVTPPVFLFITSSYDLEGQLYHVYAHHVNYEVVYVKKLSHAGN